jgi:hypothetical protein
MKKIKVHTTKRDIETGIKGSCTRCPLAYAFSRAFKRKISVGSCMFWPAYSYRYKARHLPLEAMNFVSDFDRGDIKISPFTTVVSVPNDW